MILKLAVLVLAQGLAQFNDVPGHSVRATNSVGSASGSLLFGETRVMLECDKQTTLTIVLRGDSLGGCRSTNGITYWGSPTAQPRMVVSSLTARWGDGKIEVPLSAYSDLAEVWRVRLFKAARWIVCEVSGGDAMGAYVARLMFSRSRLVRRRVWSGEFPDEWWEETRYNFMDVER